MNKLREQIAQAILTSLQNGEGFIGAADAIIALLQPRLLTKDEAHLCLNYICPYHQECDDCGVCPIGKDNACPESYKPIIAKLKLIQEEDSE